MNKRKYKTVLAVMAGALENLDDQIASLEEQVASWENRFKAEVDQRKHAQAEWDLCWSAAQEFASRLEGS